jgi:hypothetical protein
MKDIPTGRYGSGKLKVLKEFFTSFTVLEKLNKLLDYL